MTSQETCLDRLLEIFPDHIRSKRDILTDGLKDYAVVFAAESPQGTHHCIYTYMDVHAALDDASHNMTVDDGWRPMYVVELTTGKWWSVVLRASLGEEGNVE